MATLAKLYYSARRWRPGTQAGEIVKNICKASLVPIAGSILVCIFITVTRGRFSFRAKDFY